VSDAPRLVFNLVPCILQQQHIACDLSMAPWLPGYQQQLDFSGYLPEEFAALECSEMEGFLHLANASNMQPRQFQNLQDQPDRDEPITTLMIHSIPSFYTREMLVKELDEMGFENKYNFVHLPVDRSTGHNIAYAFVNFTSSSVAEDAARKFDGYQFSKQLSRRHSRIRRGGLQSWTSPAHLQGLIKNLEHYRTTTSRPLILDVDAQ